MKNLAIREQRRADGVSLDGCYNCAVIVHISRECPSGREGGGGRGWGRRGGRGGRGGGRGPPGAREQDNHDTAPATNQGALDGNNDKFQEITGVVGCIHGEASLPPSNGAYKRFVQELNAVISTPPKPLEWSGQVISFDPMDHPSNVDGVGALPLVVSPVIHNFRVTKMLVDGGSSLNLLTAKVLATLQIPQSRLQDTGAF